jgi:hypothetical protein
MKEKFKELADKYSNLGEAIIFSKLVKGRKMCRNEVSRWLLLLIPHSEYVGTPKSELTEFYYKLSNGL